jgi:hypothetical protein
MKIFLLSSALFLSFATFASDMKERFLAAAKDKKNQEQAKEIAQKGVDYIKEQNANKVEVKAEPAPVAVTPEPAPAPVSEKVVRPKTKTKKVKSKK